MRGTWHGEIARSDASSRMMTISGLGRITAMEVEAFAPTLSVFKRSRDLDAERGSYVLDHGFSRFTAFATATVDIDSFMLSSSSF
ncbi:hypothetical protein [Yoonia sp.]|uniref:hypothetical protein n=1 Tax=Yoonia sp. TaxID=2212373 RepID=UPI00397657F2